MRGSMPTVKGSMMQSCASSTLLRNFFFASQVYKKRKKMVTDEMKVILEMCFKIDTETQLNPEHGLYATIQQQLFEHPFIAFLEELEPKPSEDEREDFIRLLEFQNSYNDELFNRLDDEQKQQFLDLFRDFKAQAEDVQKQLRVTVGQSYYRDVEALILEQMREKPQQFLKKVYNRLNKQYPLRSLYSMSLFLPKDEVDEAIKTLDTSALDAKIRQAIETLDTRELDATIRQQVIGNSSSQRTYTGIRSGPSRRRSRKKRTKVRSKKRNSRK